MPIRAAFPLTTSCPGGSGAWIVPARGHVTDAFGSCAIDRPGQEEKTCHKGTDLADGTCDGPIGAAAAGKVTLPACIRSAATSCGSTTAAGSSSGTSTRRPRRETDTLRRALGWANFWDYPHNTPTLVTDGYNGDDMIVRDLRLVADAGTYFLASTPTAALDDYAGDTGAFGDVDVTDVFDLDIGSLAADIRCEITWDTESAPHAVGFDICRAPGGGRFVRAGLSLGEGYVHVDRRNTISPSGGETRTTVATGAAAMAVRILVDRTSVEVFFGRGRVVHSHRVFPLDSDTHLRLHTRGGRAVFRNLTVSALHGAVTARL